MTSGPSRIFRETSITRK